MSPLQFDEVLRLLPADWQATLVGRSVEPAAGMSGAAVYRVSDPAAGCRYLKIARGPDAEQLAQEITRTEWLSSRGVRTPEFLMKLRTGDMTALLMTAVRGRHLLSGADEPREDSQITALAHAIGRGFARLHALPAAECPFDETPRVRLRRARAAIDADEVDPGGFNGRNAGVAPEELYRRLAESVPVEDIAVCHGDATLENMLIGDDGKIGFIDCGHAGRSDRYLDLAVTEEALRTVFGPSAAEAFIASCGVRQWDERKAAFFRDLYELF